MLTTGEEIEKNEEIDVNSGTSDDDPLTQQTADTSDGNEKEKEKEWNVVGPKVFKPPNNLNTQKKQITGYQTSPTTITAKPCTFKYLYC